MKHIYCLLLSLGFLLGALGTGYNLSPQLDAASFAYTAQAKKRANRSELFTEYKTLKTESYKKYNKAIYKIALSCAKSGLIERASEIYEEIALNDSQYKNLDKLSEAIDNAEEKENNKKLAASNKKYLRAQKGYAKVLIPFTQRLIEKKLYGLAYDNIQQILLCDPNNKKVRKYIGHVYNRKQKKWMNEFENHKIKKEGLIWNQELGWTLLKEQAKYDDGQYYDYTSDTWGKIEDLNKLHNTLDTAWPIITQHFEIYAACDLAIGIEAANELEALYQAWIRDFVSFFGNLALERLFDKSASPRKLKIYIFATRDSFMEFSQRHKMNDPLLAESIGYYSPKLKSSQFFLSDDWLRTLWHEVTHQLFGENCNQKGTSRTALAEGLAVYMEYGRVEKGRIILDIGENEDIQREADNIRAGMPKSFTSFWDLKHEQFHGEKRGQNYALSGLCVFFLMQYDNGRFRPDFIDYLTESHQFPKEGGPIYDYLGISKNELEKLFKQWIKAEFP